MKTILDRLDSLFGGNRRAVRALLIVIAIPVVVIATDLVISSVLFPEPACQFLCDLSQPEIKATAEAISDEVVKELNDRQPPP